MRNPVPGSGIPRLPRRGGRNLVFDEAGDCLQGAAGISKRALPILVKGKGQGTGVFGKVVALLPNKICAPVKPATQPRLPIYGKEVWATPLQPPL